MELEKVRAARTVVINYGNGQYAGSVWKRWVQAGGEYWLLLGNRPREPPAGVRVNIKWKFIATRKTGHSVLDFMSEGERGRKKRSKTLGNELDSGTRLWLRLTRNGRPYFSCIRLFCYEFQEQSLWLNRQILQRSKRRWTSNRTVWDVVGLEKCSDTVLHLLSVGLACSPNRFLSVLWGWVFASELGEL